jgi:hypothetical protein
MSKSRSATNRLTQWDDQHDQHDPPHPLCNFVWSVRFGGVYKSRPRKLASKDPQRHLVDIRHSSRNIKVLEVIEKTRSEVLYFFLTYDEVLYSLSRMRKHSRLQRDRFVTRLKGVQTNHHASSEGRDLGATTPQTI